MPLYNYIKTIVITVNNYDSFHMAAHYILYKDSE